MHAFHQHKARSVYLLLLAFWIPLSSFSQPEKESPQTPSALRLNVDFPGYKQDSLTFTNASPPYIFVRLEHIGADPITYLTQGRRRINHACLTMVLTEDNGTMHRFTPWEGPDYLSKNFNYKVIRPQESYHYVQFNLLTVSQPYHWAWWQQVGFPPGNYQLYVEFRYPEDYQAFIKDKADVWNDHLRSDTIHFRIAYEEDFDMRPPHDRTAVIDTNYYGMPKHVIFYNQRGQLTGERFYYQSNGYPNEPVFQVVYDHPISTSPNWKAGSGIRILEGQGSSGVAAWEPQDSTLMDSIDGKAWVWQYDHKGNHLKYRINYLNGKLEGDFTIFENFERVTGAFHQGKKEGPWITTFKGDTIFEHAFVNGNLHGKFFAKDPHTGDSLVSEFYVHGQKHGVFKTFNREGGLWERKAFDHDKPVGTWIWNTYDGKNIARGEYRDGVPYEGSFYIDRYSPASGKGFVIIHHYKAGKRVE